MRSIQAFLRPVALGAALLAAAAGVSAAQRVAAKPNTPVFVQASTVEVNRVSVEGGKIAHVILGQRGVLEYSEDNGVLFVAFTTKDAGQSVSLYVTDDNERRYQIVLRGTPSVGEDITLVPPAGDTVAASTGGGSRAYRAPSIIRSSMTMIQALAGLSDPEIIAQSPAPKAVDLWQGADFFLVRSVRTGPLVAELYVLTNTSGEPLGMREEEFYGVLPRVMAVGVQFAHVPPGASSRIYIVREAGSNE